MGKYFSKKRMEPKLWKIGRDFNLATHVGMDLSGNIYVYSRDPVHFPNGYYLPDGIGEMQKIGELGHVCNDWEKYKWEIRRDERSVKEVDIEMLRASCPEITENGPHIKDLEPFGELPDVDVVNAADTESDPVHGIYIEYDMTPPSAPQIQITEEQSPEDAALEVLGKVAAVIKECFDSVLPVLEDVAQQIRGIYEIMEAEKARHEDLAVDPVIIQLRDTGEGDE